MSKRIWVIFSRRVIYYVKFLHQRIHGLNILKRNSIKIKSRSLKKCLFSSLCSMILDYLYNKNRMTANSSKSVVDNKSCKIPAYDSYCRDRFMPSADILCQTIRISCASSTKLHESPQSHQWSNMYAHTACFPHISIEFAYNINFPCNIFQPKAPYKVFNFNFPKGLNLPVN